MEQKENMEETFDLEEILKEFSHTPQEEKETPPPEEDILIWDGIMPEKTESAPWSPEDTVRLDRVIEAIRQQEKEKMEQTVAFAPVGQEEKVASVSQEDSALEQTVAFTPVGQKDDEEIYMPVPEEPEVEPYSGQWEPEYEQPIGEYVPPQPIVFRPKSRLHELKRKLIAGPEKRYYELLEQGFGKLQAAIAVNFLVALIAIAVTVMEATGFLGEGRIKFAIFVQFLSLLLSALFGSYQLMEGFTDMACKRFSLNSLLWFSLFACLADGLLCFNQMRVPCCAAFSLNMTMSLWSAYQKRNTEMGQMDTLRMATRLDSLVSWQDYYENRPGFLRGEGQVEDFMDHYQDVSGSHQVISRYAFVALIAGAVIGIVAGVLHGLSMGLQIFAVSLLVAVPASAYVSLSRPMAILERRLHKLGTVLCGWAGVKALSADGVFPLTDTDLFPAGASKLNGVKFYGKRESDEVIAYAAALICADANGMAPLFSQLLESRSGYHYECEEIRGYAGGIGGIINGEAVLAGTRAFMESMGVDMPESAGVSQAVYVAIDGQLSGVFAISYAKTKNSARGFYTLCAYGKLSPVLIGEDFMLTEGFLRNKFGVNTRQMIFPGRKTREELRQVKPTEQDRVWALMTQEGLAGAAYAVTGARTVHTACRLGVAVHMAGGILGLVMMLLLSIVGARELLTPSNVLLYELLWMIPGLLITEWTRNI